MKQLHDMGVLVTCKSLRIIGVTVSARWQDNLQLLSRRLGVACQISGIQLDEVELVLHGGRMQIEALGQDILDGALGTPAKAVALTGPQSGSFFLRREADCA